MSGSKITPVVAWDTSVFLAWFQKEPDKPLQDIRMAAREITDQKVMLRVSAITRIEVLDFAETDESREKYRSFLKRSNVYEILPDSRIIDLAHEIRQKAHALNASGKYGCRKLETCDALIAASAIIYKVPVLFSFDLALLGYNGHEVLRGLEVSHPRPLAPSPRQRAMPLFDETTEDGPDSVVSAESRASIPEHDDGRMADKIETPVTHEGRKENGTIA